MSVLKVNYPELFNFIEEKKVAITYSPEFREFGIKLHDGVGMQIIYYCPWTGKKLPEGLADNYYDILDGLGIEPYEHDKIPDEMKSEEWWIKRKL